MSKVVIITGSNSGFGRLTAETLAKAGHQVFATMRNVNGKNAQAAKEMADWAAKEALNLQVLELDVTDDNSTNQAAKTVFEKAGCIDVLVNNAGFGVAGLQEAYTIEQVKSVFEVNVFGVLRMNRAVLPYMRQQKSGLIINISSGLGRVVLPFTGPYTASKFALEALSENMRYELKSLGIDSVIIEPGAYPTDFAGSMLQPADAERLKEYGAMAEMPMKMFAGLFASLKDNPPNPQDIADIAKRLMDTPNGERPIRTVSGSSSGGALAINEISEKVQEKLLQMLGMN